MLVSQKAQIYNILKIKFTAGEGAVKNQSFFIFKNVASTEAANQGSLFIFLGTDLLYPQERI